MSNPLHLSAAKFFAVKLIAARISVALTLLGLWSSTLSSCTLQADDPSTPKTQLTLSTSTPTTPATSAVLTSTIQADFTPTHTPLLSPTPSDPIPSEDIFVRTQYTLSATLDYGQHLLIVDEYISFTNNSSDPIPDMVLMVASLYFPGVFQLNSLSVGDETNITNYSLENGQLGFVLPQALFPEENIQLDLSYELKLPSPTPSVDTRPVPFGYTPRQTNLVDWYPFIPPYETGVGWMAHPASYYGEHLVYEISDFDVSIQLLDDREDLVIAASAPAIVENNAHTYHQEAARNFAWSISHNYQVITQTVGPVTVLSYYFPMHAAAGETVLKTTAESMELYTHLFGPYPRPILSVVEADFLDGMEFDGLYFLSNGFYNLYSSTPGEYLVAIAAHETAHQWWYGLVGNDQALEPWLDEAMCTYSERLFYENLYPEALDWWWEYRINYYDPHGWVDDSIYNPHGETEPYRAYRDAIYLNGAVFLEELRSLIGDQAFFDFLQNYTAQYSGKIATTEGFFALLKGYTQEDLTPLLEKYFAK